MAIESFVLEKSASAEILILVGDFKVLAVMALLGIALYLSFNSKPVYLVDFMCYKAPETFRAPLSAFIEHEERSGEYSSQTIEFQTKIIERSGIGNETYLPSGLHLLPPDHTLNSAIEEVEMVLFTIVQDLITKDKINPKSIDIFVTNCSLLCPVPSLATMVINKFGFRRNILSFNLSGMGCSASILSISLAQDLLKVHKRSLALVLSMEAVCSSSYRGSNKSMLLSNCLFRMGGAAILLSNCKRHRRIAKYELQHLVRTHLGAKENSYQCIFQATDNEGHTGVALSRSIPQVANDALQGNISTLAALVLPYSELIRYGLSILWKKVWPPAKKRGSYIPDFKKAFDHFCVHAGGRAVLDAIKENLKLKDRDLEALKMNLYRFGNTSSSSIWYTLIYLEAKRRVRKGDRIWQLAFGSGFKCNSAVWFCISMIEPDDSNAWSDRIGQYPVEVPELMDH